MPTTCTRRLRSPRRPCLAPAALAALLLLVVPPARAGAQDLSALQGLGETLLQRVGDAVVAVSRGDNAGAAAALAEAQGIAGQMTAMARDGATAAELGRRAAAVARAMAALGTRLGRAGEIAADPAGNPKRQLKVLRAAYARTLQAGSRLGRPVIEEVNARSAGFHRPGERVTFRIYAADGSPCTEPPVVTVQNQFSSEAVDLGLVAAANGEVSLTMGSGKGGARVTVTACGRSSTRLLYNYGARVPAGLPEGFPAGLPHGTYALSFWATGVVNIPETPLGTFQNTDIRAFAKQLLAAFQQAVAAVSVPGCTSGVGYSPFDGTSFTVTIPVTCTSNGVTASITVSFRVRRL